MRTSQIYLRNRCEPEIFTAMLSFCIAMSRALDSLPAQCSDSSTDCKSDDNRVPSRDGNVLRELQIRMWYMGGVTSSLLESGDINECWDGGLGRLCNG